MGQSSPTFPQTHNRLAFNMTITNLFDYGYSVGSGSPGHHSVYTTGYNNYIPPRSYTYAYPTVYGYGGYGGYGGYAGYGRYGGYGHGGHGHVFEGYGTAGHGMLDMEDMVDMVSPDMDTSLDMVMDYMDMGDKFLL